MKCPYSYWYIIVTVCGEGEASHVFVNVFVIPGQTGLLSWLVDCVGLGGKTNTAVYLLLVIFGTGIIIYTG